MRSPEERLARLLQHAHRGWQRIHEQPDARERARCWIGDHPSARPEIDRLWLEGLAGTGPLADWFADGGRPERWRQSIPLHSVLASHPFPDLAQWWTPRKSPSS